MKCKEALTKCKENKEDMKKSLTRCSVTLQKFQQNSGVFEDVTKEMKTANQEITDSEQKLAAAARQEEEDEFNEKKRQQANAEKKQITGTRRTEEQRKKLEEEAEA